MKDQIIETAGRVWKYLANNGETSIAKLPKLLKEKDAVVYQALGWLAREDKVSYTTKKRQTVISLTEAEIESFSNANTQSDNAQLEPIAV